jgi:hypothetical protein
LVHDDVFVCRFSTGFKSAAVVVDARESVIHFENCHVPRKNFATASAKFSCPVSDIKAVHRFTYRGESLTIVTATGKALVPSTATNYGRLCEYLRKAVPVNAPGFSADDPRMGFVYVAGALIGLGGGVFLTPRNSSDFTLGMFVLVGTVLGVVGGHLLVRLGDRLAGVSLVPPFVGGVFGLILGFSVSKVVAVATEGKVEWAGELALAGTVLGVLLGTAAVIRAVLRKRRSGDLPSVQEAAPSDTGQSPRPE